LEGLEAVEVLKSSLNEDIRVDAQYFRKRYIYEDTCRRHFESVSLGSQAFITDGPHGYHEVDLSSPIAMLTARCAKAWFADRSLADTISTKTDDSNRRSALEENDLILSTRGTVGACAIVEPLSLPANIDQDVARIAIKADARVSVRYVLVYLNSTFGQDWIERNSTGMVQQGLSLARVRELPIPLLSAHFQGRIDETITTASQLRRSAEASLANADAELLHALSLDDWKAPEPLTYVRSSRDALAANRLDAQHFQPRFDALANFIDATGQCAMLGDCLVANSRGKQPAYGDGGLPVVNSKHVLRGEVRLDGDNRLAVPGEVDVLIRPGDVLINGTGVGTIGRAAPYLHDGPAVPDNHVTVLRPAPGLDAVYLSVFLNSKAGQWQVEQRLRGSSGQIELYPNDIAQFKIWLAPQSVQEAIRRQVEQSFSARQRASQLLEAAKRAVEIAIEDSETAALAYLRSMMALEPKSDGFLSII